MNANMRNGSGPPVEYGRRLLPVELDRVAQFEPETPYFSRPRDPNNLAAGFEDITYRRIANAANRLAHWLESELGPAKNFETVAYLAPPDIRNILLVLAVSKVGYQASLLFTVEKL